jgi:hypothetical protein
MCYLVTIGTTKSRADIKRLLGDDRLLRVGPSKNSSMRFIFPASDELFEVTSGHCSCDLIIHGTEPISDKQRSTLRQKYKRNGWSETRIDRALADLESAQNRRSIARNAPRARFHSLLRALAVESPGGVRVVIHLYSGRFDFEDVNAPERVSVPIDRLDEAGALVEDALLEIRNTT